MSLTQKLKAKSFQYPNMAYFFALIAYTTMAFSQILFKYVVHVITPHQGLFYRATCLIMMNTYFLRQSKLSPYISNGKLLRLIIVRLIFSTSYAIIMFQSIKYLPISTLNSLNNTSPIFIFFIEAIYFKKKLNKTSLMLTVVSFIGIIFIIKPEFIFSSDGLPAQQGFVFHSIMMLIGAFNFSMGMIFVHESASFKVDVIVNLQYSYLAHLLCTSMMSNFQQPYINVAEISILYVFAFIGVAVFSMITQYTLFTANSLKKPSYTMPFGYFGVIVSFLSDVYLFKIQFDFLSVFGMILTSIGLLSKYLIGQEQKIQQKRTSYQIQDFPNEVDEVIQQQQNKSKPNIKI